MAKLIAPNETIWFVRSDATFLPTAPTATALIADLTGGSPKAIKISGAVARGYTLAAADSDTTDDADIEQGANSETRGAQNYEVDISIFLEASPLVNTTSDYLLTEAYLKTKGTSGWLVKRLGYLGTVAAAAGQEVSIFGVEVDNARIVNPESGAIQKQIPFSPTGFMSLNVALA